MSDNSHRFPEGAREVSAPTRATAAIRFRIVGPVAALSHAETFRVLQRACVRADVPVRYSEGFNPHPKLSLPLPRPVGVESEDELLVARLYEDPTARPGLDPTECETAMVRALAGQLPEGMDVLSVSLAPSNASFNPRSAEYVLPLGGEAGACSADRLQGGIDRVMASESCVVERTAGEDKPARRIDVRPFLLSIRFEDGHLIVRHLTGDVGSIRVDEILRLFSLRTEDLAGPVRRSNVVWETTKLQEATQTPRMESGAEDIEDGSRNAD